MFGKRLLEHLLEELPKQEVTIASEVLATRIKHGIQNAEYYALTTEADIAKYIELMCIGFPNRTEAEDPPEIRSLMYDRRLDSSQRLTKLKDQCITARKKV